MITMLLRTEYGIANKIHNCFLVKLCGITSINKQICVPNFKDSQNSIVIRHLFENKTITGIEIPLKYINSRFPGTIDLV